MINKRNLQMLLALFFILGSYKGYLALYGEDFQEPKQVFPVAVESLPYLDQKKLEKGIRIRDMEELAQRMEDYLS